MTNKNGATRLEYILGRPLADDVIRQWPQMEEVVRSSRLIADVEGNFPELTLEVGRRLQLDDVVVVEWTCDYGDGRLYRNVTIGELEEGRAVRVTDYWGGPTSTPEWRRRLTDRLDMPGDGTWPAADRLAHHQRVRSRRRAVGQKSSVCVRVIERLYGNSHLLNDAGQYAYYGRVGGCLITGNEDGIKHCAMEILYSLGHLGFTVPPQADAGWIGEAGPGPSYLDDGSGGPDNDFTNRNTTFMTWNLMHLARMLKDAGGVPAHGNQRTEWDAGCRFDYPNPEHR